MASGAPAVSTAATMTGATSAGIPNRVPMVAATRLDP